MSTAGTGFKVYNMEDFSAEEENTSALGGLERPLALGYLKGLPWESLG